MLYRSSRCIVSTITLVVLVTSALRAEEPARDVRKEILPLLERVARPLGAPARTGEAWLVDVSARVDDGDFSGRLVLGWDGSGRAALRFELAEMGKVHAAFTEDGDWMWLPRHGVLFTSAPAAEAGSPLEESQLWPIVKLQLAGAVVAARFAPVPDDLRLLETGPDTFRVGSRSGTWEVDIEGRAGGGPMRLRAEKPVDLRLEIARLEKVDSDELHPLLRAPDAPARTEIVAEGEIRAMLATAVDLVSEKALWNLRPTVVPSLLEGIDRIDGRPVLVLRGTPEEIGREYGQRLRAAVRSNARRVLYGIGLFETVRSGRWFPRTLKAAWETQKKHVPERYRREMDALADAVGLPREHAYWTNLFPEMFHCSGLALRGKATVGGKLLHGRILDYMTEVGFQATAVVTVIAPEGRFAWINVGYAGCVGTVTAMNERGLAMGEMGGRGEGHLDGMPMAFLMREVVERFETTDDAIRWIRSVPRTCEYFYVLSDAATCGMAGIASLARSLAAERGVDDLQVVFPGEAHPLLPHAMDDVVLMSAGSRYERLAERVRSHYGKITPQVAWDIMGEGVAMTSALHIALFQPDTLELWVAEASLDARPAYTQPVTRLNLRELLETRVTARSPPE